MHGLRLAADVVGNAGLGHEVSLVRRVDEHRPGETAAVLRAERHDPPAFLLDAAGAEVEPRLEDHLDTRLAQPVAIDLLGDVRLERPHLLLTGGAPS